MSHSIQQTICARGQDEELKRTASAINYQIDGPERAPWLVFSNSLATSLAMWDEQAAALANSFRILRYDQRGHGGSDAPAGRYTFDTLVDDVVALMDALGIKQAHFAGLSMGGATALGLAERHPTASSASSSPIHPANRRRKAASNGKSGSRWRRKKASKLWSSRPSRAGFRRKPSPAIRRISIKFAR